MPLLVAGEQSACAQTILAKGSKDMMSQFEVEPG